jgi:hypothetical protein
MKRPAIVIVPVLLATLLGGCALSPGAQPDIPLQDLVDLIPWAKSVAADASADELTARIAEITAGLPTLDISDAGRAEIEGKLRALDAAIRADPSNPATHATELNAILDQVKTALG